MIRGLKIVSLIVLIYAILLSAIALLVWFVKYFFSSVFMVATAGLFFAVYIWRFYTHAEKLAHSYPFQGEFQGQIWDRRRLVLPIGCFGSTLPGFFSGRIGGNSLGLYLDIIPSIGENRSRMLIPWSEMGSGGAVTGLMARCCPGSVRLYLKTKPNVSLLLPPDMVDALLAAFPEQWPR